MGIDQTEATQDKFWMQVALDCAKTALEENEVPVGAVLVANNQLLAKAHNRPIAFHDPSAHAEMLALRKAGKILQNYRLVDTTLYVTLEPCPMCASALVHARIKRLVFGAKDPKTGACGSVINLLHSPVSNHFVTVTGGVLAEACGKLLSNFFKAKRQTKTL